MGENIRKLLRDKFAKHHFREFKAVWIAATGSILDLLSERFIEDNDKNNFRWSIYEFLKVLVFFITDLVELNHDVISHLQKFPKI